MLYLWMTQLGWLAFTVLLIVVVALYTKIKREITYLRRDVTKLQAELDQQAKRSVTSSATQLVDDGAHTRKNLSKDTDAVTETDTIAGIRDNATKDPIVDSNRRIPVSSPPPLPTTDSTPTNDIKSDASDQKSVAPLDPIAAKNNDKNTPIEPDERSLPIVTSLIHSIKNWFFGGNLVVRVGVLVLLVGVVLLLRLLSEYIEISITTKLVTIGAAGLALAALGFKLTAKRFSYGITLQGAGLAITYLSTFFAYSVYEIMPSVPSFIGLGILSAITIALAVRQNAFPLALLALSGGFFAPILTSESTGSLTALFGYYLLLNITIAVIAHYRPWKVLNLLGVTVTFGLAYYWGLTEDLPAIIETQRWPLVLITALHVLLYLFVVIRYAQHVIDYSTASTTNDQAPDRLSLANSSSQAIFPIDTSLLFSAPVLAFGVLAALLDGVSHGLTITACILALLYLGTGYVFVKQSPRYLLVTESMLALGAGFLAIMVALALDANWMTCGWSIQALALVWLGERSKRTWSVYFGLGLHVLSVAWLWLLDIPSQLSAGDTSLMLVWLLVAWLPLVSAYLLRHFSLFDAISKWHQTKIAHWQRRWLIYAFSLLATCWSIWATYIAFELWLAVSVTTLFILAVIIHSLGFWLIDSKTPWAQARRINRAVLLALYSFMLTFTPIIIIFSHRWDNIEWRYFIISALMVLGVALLWLKRWYQAGEQRYVDPTSLLITALSVLFYTLALRSNAEHIAPPMLLVALLYVIPLYLTHKQISTYASERKQTLIARAPAWLNLPHALIGTGKALLPIALFWVVFSNYYSDGAVWQLPYLPVLSIIDVSMGLVIAASLLLLRLLQQVRSPNTVFTERYRHTLIILALIAFWWLSSILVRSLHAFIGTPLWDGAQGGAWSSEQVQTGLTILWTLLALVATIVASRYWQRALWFMGIGLLGIVVLKLVLVDLSQTEAIWRVISFIGAGSLILLIGYLAPLPPADEEIEKPSQS